MDDVIEPTGRACRDGAGSQSDEAEEAQIEARLRMESMSRVACALIFQSARDLVCAHRTAARPEAHHRKTVRDASRWKQEISIWAKTLYPLQYESGGLTLAGAIHTINVNQDFRGGRRLDYWAVRECLLREPHRLAVVDGPTEFRTLTAEPSDDGAVLERKKPEPAVELTDVLFRVTSAFKEAVIAAGGEGEFTP